MAMVKNPYSYTKMEKEDPEEIIHRRAQFLIQKILERADTEISTRQQQRRSMRSSSSSSSSSSSRTTSFVRKRVVGIRVRIGRRLRRLRKSVIVHVRFVKNGVCNNLMGPFKSWRRLFCGSARNVSPLFVLSV